MVALLVWIGRVTQSGRTPVVQDFARELGQNDLLREAEALQRALLEPGSSWSGAALAAALKAARRETLRRRSARTTDPANLNPPPPSAGHSLGRSLARGLSR